MQKDNPKIKAAPHYIYVRTFSLEGSSIRNIPIDPKENIKT